jgi:hypothetical protein
MLKTTQAVSRTRSAAADLNVEITRVATALAAYKLSQAQAAKQAGAGRFGPARDNLLARRQLARGEVAAE